MIVNKIMVAFLGLFRLNCLNSLSTGAKGKKIMKNRITVNTTLTFKNEKGEKDYIVIFRDEAHMNASYPCASSLEFISTDSIIRMWEQQFGQPYKGERTREAAINAVMAITNKMYYEAHYASTKWGDLDADYTAKNYFGHKIKVLDLA